VLTLGAAHLIAACSARGLAVRTATTVSAYLSFVAPPARGASDYDLARLLVLARALESLLQATPAVEVYHGTAPLVHGGARPLTTAELAQLRRDRATEWWGHAAFAPVFDRDAWGIIGAVRVPGAALAPGWLAWTTLGLLIVALALTGRVVLEAGRGEQVDPRVMAWCAAAGVCLGIGAYALVWSAAREATDRWLVDASALVQEAGTRGPGKQGLAWAAPLVRGAELVPAERASRVPVRRRLGGQALGVVTLRLRGGRWAELRTPAAESDTWRWLAWLLGLALVGPAASAMAARLGPTGA
jgi:hypothetical protein